MAKAVYTITQALEKGMQYCAYQERCQSEVRYKLNTFQLTSVEVEEVIASLILQNYLNEERFSKAFCRGKFRMKSWGKKKIELALKQKQISSYCIRIGLKEIEDSEYEKALSLLVIKTWEKNKGVQNYQRSAKTAQYIIGRGFEAHLVWDQIKEKCND